MFVFFGQFSDKSGPKIPNSFRTNWPHTASQAKVPCRKWSYTDPLIMRFSKKCVTEGRKPLTVLSNFTFSEIIGTFLLKKLLFILSRLGWVSTGDMSPGATSEMSPVATGDMCQHKAPKRGHDYFISLGTIKKNSFWRLHLFLQVRCCRSEGRGPIS